MLRQLVKLMKSIFSTEDLTPSRRHHYSPRYSHPIRKAPDKKAPYRLALVIQFPLADSRRFLDSETGLLACPTWPSPSPDNEFVRAFGIIRRRKRGGITGWVGENLICEANRAIRFPQNLSYVDAESGAQFGLRCPFRRFFFDGLAVGKFEVAITLRGKDEHKIKLINIKRFVRHCLTLHVEIRAKSGKYERCELGQAGPHLASLYSFSSANTSTNQRLSEANWWVTAGSPLLFLDYEITAYYNDYEPTIRPFLGGASSYKRRIAVSVQSDFALLHWMTPYAGRELPVWEIVERSGRIIRLYLLRLHAEHECLKLILKHIADGRIPVAPHTRATELLQLYLNEATRKIARCEARSRKYLGELALDEPPDSQPELGEMEVADIARASEDIIKPGERDALLNMLKLVSIRRNVFRKVEAYTHQWQTTTTIVEHMEVHMGDVFKNIQNSIIATRGAIAEGIISVEQQGREDVAKAIAELDRLIAETADSALTVGKKAEGADLLKAITEEAAKAQPNKNVLRALGDSLLSIMTSVEPIAKAGKAAFDIIKSLWA